MDAVPVPPETEGAAVAVPALISPAVALPDDTAGAELAPMAEYMVVLACGAEIGAAVLATLLLRLFGRLTIEADGVVTLGFATAAGVPPIPALIRLFGRLTIEADGVVTLGFATAAGVPPIPALIRPEPPVVVPGVPVVPGPGPTVVPVGLVYPRLPALAPGK